MDRLALAAAHLDVRLAAVNRACRTLVGAQQAASEALDRPDLADRCVTDQQVALLLERVEAYVGAPVCPSAPAGLTPTEQGVEDELRRLAAAIPTRLPLDELSDRFGLDELERSALVVAAAPELDRGYERIFVYLHDEVDRRAVSVELLLLLTTGLADRHVQRVALGPDGRLRRLGLLQPADRVVPTDLRQELRLGPGVLNVMLGTPIDVADLVEDPGWVDPLDPRHPMPVTTPHALADLARALATGAVDVVGAWGPDAAAAAEVGAAVARAGGRGLRRIDLAELSARTLLEAGEALKRALRRAAVDDAILLVDLYELQDTPASEQLLRCASSILADSSRPTVLCGRRPWRPVKLLRHRCFVDVTVSDGGSDSRIARWRSECAELSPTVAADLSARFRLLPSEIAAAAASARASAVVTPPDDPLALLSRSAAGVSAVAGSDLVSVSSPRRGPDDLILPDGLHRQVLEIAAFTRALPRVVEDWGFGRMTPGDAALKALFVGDPGTGKTLAAEVIASVLGVQLLKVDLSRAVSKWVGETSKNLELIFREAEASSAVLFFDEADALFGKRGEVRHGTDRYANTEVSHLLQRFEQHIGLVILASNLRENIDPAFTRRFDVVVPFPRPSVTDRTRLWQLAFPPQAPIGDELDIPFLAKLDLTGAGIAGAGRMAAFLAADDGAERISMTHVVRGLTRQFRAEGRVIGAPELGRYATLVEGGS
jgi:hypothetical protein